MPTVLYGIPMPEPIVGRLEEMVFDRHKNEVAAVLARLDRVNDSCLLDEDVVQITAGMLRHIRALLGEEL